MAAVTPSTLTRHSMGDLTFFIAVFANTTDDGDTYASGLGSNVLGFWANGTDDPTQGKEGIDVSESSGTFTFNTGEDDRGITLYIVATV
jgi:hypothetical protein